VTADIETSIRASRRRVARSRGALSGILLVILGLWAALVPFIGPYFNLAFTPQPNTAWHWTSARGWLEVLPGAAAFLGGMLLLFSASRAATIFGGWLAALGGAWLVVGPPLADAMNLNPGQPDPSLGTNTRALASLLFFYAVGAAILFFASLALGRVSVLSVRDVRAAERRAEAEEAERRAAIEAGAAQERERYRAEEADAADAGRHSEAGRPNGARDDERVDGRVGDSNRRGGLFHRHRNTDNRNSDNRVRHDAPQGADGAVGADGAGQYQDGSAGSTPQQYPAAPPPPRQV
jgi:hypothetical protein